MSLKNKNMSTDKMTIISNLEITEEKYEEAYNYLYDEYGVHIHLWNDEKLQKEIENYISDRD